MPNLKFSKMRPKVLRNISCCAFALALLASFAPSVNALNKKSRFDAAVVRLRKMKFVMARKIGPSALTAPSEYYRLMLQCLKYGSEEDFERLLENRRPVVRVMGLVCLAQANPARYKSIHGKYVSDEAHVWVAHGCVLAQSTVGHIAKLLLKEPKLLELE